MFKLFSNKYREYSYIWDKNSEWAIYKSSYEYQNLSINVTGDRSKLYRLWKYIDPGSSDKSATEIMSYVNDLAEGWHNVRVLSKDDIQKYSGLCSKYECECKIETENIIDYDIAHIETAESIICPDDIFDELVQYAIKKGAKMYDL